MTVHGKALALQLQLLQYNHAPPTPHHIPLLPPHTGNLYVTGIAADINRDLQHTKFAPRAFGELSTQIPLLLKHDPNIIAGEVFALSYTAAGAVAIGATLSNDYAKRCGGFSVGVTVLDYTMAAEGVATITKAKIDEVTVTDCPANPQCLIQHRYPTPASVMHFDLAKQWVATFHKMAEAIAAEVVKTQRQAPQVHRPVASPTQFAQLVEELRNAH